MVNERVLIDSMTPGIESGLIAECQGSFLCMTIIAEGYCYLSPGIGRIRVFYVDTAGSMAYLTSGVFEFRCLLDTDKTAGLAIACCMAGIALADFFRGKTFLHPDDTLKGMTFS